MRNVAALTALSSNYDLSAIKLSYDEDLPTLQGVPLLTDAASMVAWAEQLEQAVYASLDSLKPDHERQMPAHYRFESVLWLQAVRFSVGGEPFAPNRLLMIDDVQRLRRSQRELLIDELTIMRPTIPVWLSERTVAMDEVALLSQGAREGRDVREYSLEELWSSSKGGAQSFVAFAQNVLDRRMKRQDSLASSFSQCLRSELTPAEVQAVFEKGVLKFDAWAEHLRDRPRYAESLRTASAFSNEPGLNSLIELYSIRILLARDEAKRQSTFVELLLSNEELESRDSSQVRAAAELFAHAEADLPYYFGLDKLASVASNNVEELLFFASELYVGLQARQMLRKPDLIISPAAQEKLLKAAAKKRRDFIPKNHQQGSRAQKLLDAIGAFCRSRTFPPNAPYAPGVTGIRLNQSELQRVIRAHNTSAPSLMMLRKVIAECVAENLLIVKPSAPSGSREAGTVFYLSRALCMHYDLPLQYGGWQDIRASELEKWMESGRPQVMPLDLEMP
jgi:hypothetical protein